MKMSLTLIFIVFISCISSSDAIGQRNVPFDPGFSSLTGNALRRTLLSSLEGQGITSLNPSPVQHAFFEIRAIDYDVRGIKDITLGTDFVGGQLTTGQVASGRETGFHAIISLPKIEGDWEDFGSRSGQGQLPSGAFTAVFSDAVGLQAVTARQAGDRVGIDIPLIFVQPTNRIATTFGLGFDYFNSQDSLDYQTQAGGVFNDPGRVLVQTNNKALYFGGNVDLAWFFNRFKIHFGCDLGLGPNTAEKQLNVVNPIVGGGSIVSTTDVSADSLSLMCVLDAGVSAQVTPAVSVKGGYRVSGYSGLATAENQIPDVFERLDSVDASGSRLFNGFYVGVDVIFGLPFQRTAGY